MLARYRAFRLSAPYLSVVQKKNTIRKTGVCGLSSQHVHAASLFRWTEVIAPPRNPRVSVQSYMSTCVFSGFQPRERKVD